TEGAVARHVRSRIDGAADSRGSRSGRCRGLRDVPREADFAAVAGAGSIGSAGAPPAERIDDTAGTGGKRKRVVGSRPFYVDRRWSGPRLESVPSARVLAGTLPGTSS